jgi:hypothetical protein
MTTTDILTDMVLVKTEKSGRNDLSDTELAGLSAGYLVALTSGACGLFALRPHAAGALRRWFPTRA